MPWFVLIQEKEELHENHLSGEGLGGGIGFAHKKDKSSREVGVGAAPGMCTEGPRGRDRG